MAHITKRNMIIFSKLTIYIFQEKTFTLVGAVVAVGCVQLQTPGIARKSITTTETELSA